MKWYRVPCAHLLLLLMPIASLALWPRQAEAVDEAKQLAVRGRLACLDAHGQKRTSEQSCLDAPHLYVLASNDGKLYRFLAADQQTAMFADPRVRDRELQITAAAHSKDELEIIRVQSVRDGKLYDLYYFCETCNITAYAPGLCSCCWQELEFRETPQRKGGIE